MRRRRRSGALPAVLEWAGEPPAEENVEPARAGAGGEGGARPRLRGTSTGSTCATSTPTPTTGCGDHHDAEDLTEQAFLQAYRHFDRARRESDGRPLRPWLIRIAHNLASNYYRDRSRRPQTPLENADPIAARHDTEAIAEGREELRQVMANLDHLSDDRREALIMRFALGMDNREIARALGRTDGATKVLIHRAIKQLQEEMEGSGGAMSEARPLAGDWDVEALLTDALRPIDPPERLSGRLEETLSAVTQAAAEELSDWAEELSESELRALRDPRNWVRPVVAVGAGGVATGALVLLELRRRGEAEERERPTRASLAALARRGFRLGGRARRRRASPATARSPVGVARRRAGRAAPRTSASASFAPAAGRKPRIAAPGSSARPQTPSTSSRVPATSA